MKAIIRVQLKKGILDPQGKAVNNALHHLGFESIRDVRIGKYIEMDLGEVNHETATNIVEESCKKLLSNPVIEDYFYDLVEDGE
ncbi:MAG: phosphoribosylformylglycinamidine synthase subunit PurS [Calditrichia bacterium]